jgi:hypothetical protein
MENRLRSSDFRHASSFYSSASGLTTTVGFSNEEEDIRKYVLPHADPASNTCRATDGST